jgi:hypothetical protein
MRRKERREKENRKEARCQWLTLVICNPNYSEG